MGTPVVEGSIGVPVTVAPAGYGTPLRFVTNGMGVSVQPIAARGFPVAATVPARTVLTPQVVLESAALNTLVGTLSVTNGSGTYTFTLTNSAGGRFVLSGGNQIRTNALLDWEVARSHQITVNANNGAGSNFNQDIIISVVNIDDVTPVFTSTNSESNVENTRLMKALTTTCDAAASVTYSIVGGLDAGKFEIYFSQLQWLGDGVKNFEAPDDSNTDNVYQVTVRATSAPGGLTADQTITVTVTNAAEAAVNLVPPAVTGTPTEGQTLSCTTGTWTEPLLNGYTYQWFRTPTTPIPGAVNSTYILQTVDVGSNIYCRVTASNAAAAVSQNSNTVGPIAPIGGVTSGLAFTYDTPDNIPWVLW